MKYDTINRTPEQNEALATDVAFAFDIEPEDTGEDVIASLYSSFESVVNRVPEWEEFDYAEKNGQPVRSAFLGEYEGISVSLYLLGFDNAPETLHLLRHLVKKGDGTGMRLAFEMLEASDSERGTDCFMMFD